MFMRRGFSRFIPIIFFIVVFILIIAAGVSVFRLFNGSNDQSSGKVISEPVNKGLLATDVNRSVVMRLRSEIVANENFRTYEVVISPNSRNFTRYKGYLQDPIIDKSYINNTEAYTQFVYALANDNFATGTPLTGDANDTRGICPTGILYEFEVKDGETVEKHLWTTSCKGVGGSLKANVSQVQALFLAQVPAAEKYIGKD